MTAEFYPDLNSERIGGTRNALHGYARILGGWLKSCRPKRKHWWHASLRPSLTGLTTGVVHAGASFELQLNLSESLLHARTSDGAELAEELRGQSAAELAQRLDDFLIGNGIGPRLVPASEQHSKDVFADYSAASARDMARVLNSVSGAMAGFRAGISEETSPVQLWPHHFDLSMLWLPGDKIAGQDPADEESSDKQMNFGFTFGDDELAEPYFYVTAYPLPDGFPGLPLPAGTRWQTDPFNGAVLLYRTLIESSDPNGYLTDLWNSLLAAGREQMIENVP